MKITAIRMAEFGKFDAPVALEGLTGGLDILAGPNELGKSTILAATKLALTTKHGTKAKEIEAFRPYRGGAPTVEIDFECGGRKWRLSKRWLTQPRADLLERGGGKAVFRGPEAEAELEKLLSVDGARAQIPLLWLDQGHSTTAFAVPADARSLLDGAIAGEVAAMTGGDRARLVHQRVQSALDDLVTRARQQPTKAFELARRHAKTTADTLAAKRVLLDQLEDQLRLLAATRNRERAVGDPVATTARLDALARARDALETARQAKAHADRAAHERRTAQARHALVASEHAAFVAALGQLEDLDQLDAADAHQTDAAIATLAELEARNSARQQEAHAQGEVIAALLAEHATAVASERQAAARNRLAEITARLEQARAARLRADEIDALVPANRVTADALETARRHAANVRDLDTRLSAAAAVVTIDYAPGALGRIRVSGRELATGDTLTADRALVLDIEGIGAITVRPGGGEATEDTARRRDTYRRDLEALCAEVGATDLADLEARFDSRRRHEAELGELRARLTALAPAGIVALEAAQAQARVESGVEPVGTSRTPVQIEADVTAARAALVDLEAARTTLAGDIAHTREARAGRTAAAHERGLRRDQLAAALPAPHERPTRHAELTRALAEAEAAANDAARTHTAWLASAPDEPALARLIAGVTAAQAAIDHANRELQELHAKAAHAEGALTSLRNEDIASVVAELTDEAAEADAVVRRFEAEVAALKRLDQELTHAATSAEAQFLEPIKARFLPYLHMVFPGARAEIDATFGLRELVRDTAPEKLDRLSDGTREQIAVLARLAFARLLADGGRAAPVILDDALVFADDARMLRLFRALEEAANWHQVIVLTCHEKSFSDLTGRRVALQAWERVTA